MQQKNKNAVISLLRRRFTSTNYLASLITFTLAVILQFACLPNALIAKIVSVYDDLLYNIGVDAGSALLDYNGVMNLAGAFRVRITVATVIVMVIAVLYCGALWANFIICSQKKRKVEPLCFKLMKIFSIVSLVFFCVVTAVVIAVCVYFLIQPEGVITASSGTYTFDITGVSTTAAAIVLGVSVLFGTLFIIYHAAVIRGINSVIRSCVEGKCTHISEYIGFINFFWALFQLVPMAGCAYVAFNMDGSFMIPFFACLLFGAALIMYMVAVAKYNGDMAALLDYFKREKEKKRWDSVAKPRKRISDEAEPQSAPQKANGKKKFTVVIDENEQPGGENVVKCEMCGKMYDGKRNKFCPHCFYENNSMNINLKKKSN